MKTATRIVAAVIVLAAGYCLWAEVLRRPFPHAMAYVGDEGTLDQRYKLHNIFSIAPFASETPGSRGILLRDFPDSELALEKGTCINEHGIPMRDGQTDSRLRLVWESGRELISVSSTADPFVYRYSYLTKVCTPLGRADGLEAGRAQRVIPAGRSLRVCWTDSEILDMEGRPDTIRVLSDAATFQTSRGRSITLAQGKHSLRRLHPLLGRWEPLRWIGAVVVLAGVALFAISARSCRRKKRPGEHAPPPRPALPWALSVITVIVGAGTFAWGPDLLWKLTTP